MIYVVCIPVYTVYLEESRDSSNISKIGFSNSCCYSCCSSLILKFILSHSRSKLKLTVSDSKDASSELILTLAGIQVWRF